MIFFRLKTWWHYHRNALSRHGIHSPFVYRFVEEALRPALPATAFQAFREADNTGYRSDTLELLARCSHFLQQESQQEEACYLILKGTPEAIRQAAFEYIPQLSEGFCLLIPYIHDSPARAAVWKELVADKRINLSIEIWQLGLLFFRGDFQEKQHFVLRRPG
ncbi:MAG: hypothetical protein JST06_11405 [Bacteroidetes bacterium]|nr:hypothetical protein [Bacteroidota bacterium]